MYPQSTQKKGSTWLKHLKQNFYLTLPMAFSTKQARPHMSSAFQALDMAPCFSNKNDQKCLASAYPHGTLKSIGILSLSSSWKELVDSSVISIISVIPSSILLM